MMKNFWDNKKVLITGGAGFIGSHAVDRLVERKACVTAVVSPNTSKKKISDNLGKSSEKIYLKKADLLKFNDCREITRDQEIVLNFAALDGGVLFKSRYPAQIFRINAQIILNMLEASRINRIKRFLLMSSIDIYPQETPSPVKEEYAFSNKVNEKTGGYVWSKIFSEVMAKMYYREYGLKIAIARSGNVYGPRDYLDKGKGRVIPTFISRAVNNQKIRILGNGLQKISLLYVDDLAYAVLELVEKYCVCDPVNITGSYYISVKDLAKLIIKKIGKKNKLRFEPPQISSFKDRIISVEKAKKVIRFKEKVDLLKGLAKTIKYFSQI